MQNALAAHSPESVWEFGAGNVLTGLAKRISPSTARVNIDSPEALGNAAKAA